MCFTDNPVADFERYSDEQERWLEKRPCCVDCGEHIQEEYAYYVAGDWICEDCMADYKKAIPED